MEEIINVIIGYRLESVIMAILICLLTGILKLPIKKVAKSLSNGKYLTRFIVFMPLIIGFGINALFYLLLNKPLIIDGEYITSWLTATSISLALYAVIEKIFPKREKVFSTEELVANKEKIEELIQLQNNSNGDSIKNCANILQMMLSDTNNKDIKK